MRCCICLCVYNNAKGLPFVLKNILAIKSIFTQVRIIAFYDKSTDNSLDILKQYESVYGDIDIIVNQQPKGPVRTENIAFARNNLLAKIRTSYSDYEYFIMMDSNDYACVGDIRPHVIEDVLKRDDWDSISFDRDAGYYDMWALSYDPYVYSLWHFNDNPKMGRMMRAHFAEVIDNYKRNKPEELIEVYSAFNGFAIYKTSIFLDCKYSSDIYPPLFPKRSIKTQELLTGCKKVDYQVNDCEHRRFHLESIDKHKARIRISTKSVFAK